MSGAFRQPFLKRAPAKALYLGFCDLCCQPLYWPAEVLPGGVVAHPKCAEEEQALMRLYA